MDKEKNMDADTLDICIKINNILINNSNKYSVKFIEGIRFKPNIEKFFKDFRKCKMEYFLAKEEIESLSDAIIRQFIFNMFNFNFWQYPEEGFKNQSKYPRSQELLQIIDNIFIDANPDITSANFDLPFRMGDPRLLLVLKGKLADKYNNFLFKEWETYISYVDDLIELITDKSRRSKFITFIYDIIDNKITYSEMLDTMHEFLPNVYGNDIFNKRENMFVYGIVHEYESRNLDTNIKINNPNLFPIDYRIPSIIFQEGIFEIYEINEETKEETRLTLVDICNIELNKDDNLEQVFRAGAYKALIDLKRSEKFNNIKLDNFLFWTSKHNNYQHILVNTTDY